MMKSMTGFSKTEAAENGVHVTVELKSLNGKNLEINCRLPRNLLQKELEVRDLIRQSVIRGSIFVSVNIELDPSAKSFAFNEDAALACYEALTNIKKKLKLKEAVKLDNVLLFKDSFYQQEAEDDDSTQTKLLIKALKQGLKNLDMMKFREGQQITKDLTARMKKIQDNVKKIEQISLEKIPAERERLRQRVAQLFESDEIDEHRLQLEIVLLADKLDISEECTRLNSHFLFFFDTLKSKDSEGRKINFLLQEMHREINTIGSKSNDTGISHLVVAVKEELERIREQVQNIE